MFASIFYEYTNNRQKERYQNFLFKRNILSDNSVVIFQLQKEIKKEKTWKKQNPFFYKNIDLILIYYGSLSIQFCVSISSNNFPDYKCDWSYNYKSTLVWLWKTTMATTTKSKPWCLSKYCHDISWLQKTTFMLSVTLPAMSNAVLVLLCIENVINNLICM